VILPGKSLPGRNQQDFRTQSGKTGKVVRIKMGEKRLDELGRLPFIYVKKSSPGSGIIKIGNGKTQLLHKTPHRAEDLTLGRFLMKFQLSYHT